MDLVHNADVFDIIMQYIDSTQTLQNLFLAHKIFQLYISKLDSIKVCDEYYFIINAIIFSHCKNLKKITYQNDDEKDHKLFQDIKVFNSIPSNVIITSLEFVNIECDGLFILHTHRIKNITHLTLNKCHLGKGISWYREIINPCITNNVTSVCLCNMELEIIMFINATIQSKITKLKIENVICARRPQLHCISEMYKRWEAYSLPLHPYKSIKSLEITRCNMDKINSVFPTILNYLQKCKSITDLIFTYNNQNINIDEKIFPTSLERLDLRGNNVDGKNEFIKIEK
uniref:Uncharacterized protein n=1 Tax=viral metagenome TaxID=1070528 RepID=A0A6C0CA38_9ZZZZ